MIPISIFIIAKNEADRIEPIIYAVKKFADEILVIDSNSSDDTKIICERNGAKVINNNWNGFGQQKIFGEKQCRNNWILNIDADEEVSEDLANEIIKIFNENIPNNVAGFKIKIVNKFRFENKPKKHAYFYNQFRLYRKDFAGFKNSSVHDSVVINANCNLKILQLKNIIYHQSFRSYSHWLDKINYYSSMQAQEEFLKNKNPLFLKIFFAPILAFFKAYFIRRYFIYGLDGIIFSLIFAYSRFAKAIKTRELFLQKKYNEICKNENFKNIQS